MFSTNNGSQGTGDFKMTETQWGHAYLCITPPALRDAEYLQSEFGALGCKREQVEFES